MPIFIPIASALMVLLLGYVFLVAPGARRKFDLPERGYAHRGLWGEGIPENSMAAFESAVLMRLDAISMKAPTIAITQVIFTFSLSV